jgi:hypothetical protein
MADSTRESEVILRDARRSLDVQRDGGTHRRAGRGGPSIGRGSAEAKARHYARMIKRVLIACAAILMAAIAAGFVIGGLGFGGVMITFFALVAAVVVLTQFPRIKVPQRAELLRTQNARQLVARTELWLEHQRPALPAPAVTLVDQIGVQLDSLGLQLAHVDPAHPAAAETRKLVGEHLPEMVETYRKIPEPLRREQRVGSTPEAQLVDGLGRISEEIDRVTRQLADGALDDLAIRSRYLEYRYGSGDVSGDTLSADPTRPEKN